MNQSDRSVSDLAIGMRVFDGTPNNVVWPFVERYILQATGLGVRRIIIALDVQNDKHDSGQRLDEMGITNMDIIPVSPGRFPHQAHEHGEKQTRIVGGNHFLLNAMANQAARLHIPRLMITSPHVMISRAGILDLLEQFKDDTFSVGPVLTLKNFQHEYRPGETIRAESSIHLPINTLCIYNVKILQRIGFPLIIEAPDDPFYAENEEMATAALYQKLYGTRTKLIEVPGITAVDEWYDVFNIRLDKYNPAGKDSQMRWQTQMLKTDYPDIEHVFPAL